MNNKKVLLDKVKRESYKTGLHDIKKTPDQIGMELSLMTKYDYGDIKDSFVRIRKGE